jgi:hypothetical protein
MHIGMIYSIGHLKELTIVSLTGITFFHFYKSSLNLVTYT